MNAENENVAVKMVYNEDIGLPVARNPTVDGRTAYKCQ